MPPENKKREREVLDVDKLLAEQVRDALIIGGREYEIKNYGEFSHIDLEERQRCLRAWADAKNIEDPDESALAQSRILSRFCKLVFVEDVDIELVQGLPTTIINELHNFLVRRWSPVRSNGDED